MKTMKSFLIRPTFRGLVLALAVTALASFVAQAVPYASGITRNGDTVSFILNQPAAGITVLRDGANPVTPAIDATTKGVKSFDMTGYTTYSIIVTGNTAKGWIQFSEDTFVRSKYYSPRGVEVDTNPKRSTFGRIIVCEGFGGPVAAGGRTTTDGLYIMSADQADIFSQGNTAYAGGVAWPAASAGANGPFRVSMNRADPSGQDYTIYITDWTDTHSGIWTADALNPSAAFNELLSNVDRASSGLVAGLHGSVPCGPWVEGIGTDRKMYTVDEDYLMGDILQYDIGTTTSGYSTTPTVRVDGPAVNGLMDVVRDEDGSWWLATYRYTDPLYGASLLHFPDGSSTPSFSSGTNMFLHQAYGSIDIHQYEDLLVMGSSKGLIYVIDIFNRDNPKLVNSIPHSGSTIRDVAFDAAGNMYIVSPSSETLRIYSRGGFTVATTTSDGAFNLYRPTELNLTATDTTAAEEWSDAATFTITRRFQASTDLQVYFTLSGTATSNLDYTVSPTSPVTLPAGQTTVDITVTPNDDSTPEGSENVVLTVAAGDFVIEGPTNATVTIADNDVVLRYWDTNGVAVGACGDPNGFAGGTWGTDAYWNISENGDAATGTWTDWATAVFSAGNDAWGTFTVAVTGTQRIDSLQFEDGFVTLDGGTFILTNRSATKVANTACVKSVIGGAGLTFDGPGFFALAGANTYTGPTLINGGVLMVGATGGVIPDGSAVTIGATGQLNLYDGYFSMSSYDETIGSLAGAGGAIVNVPMGNTLTFGSDNTDTLWDGTTQGGGSLIKVGTGLINIGDAGVIAEPLTISAGKVQISSAGDLGVAGNFNPITIENGATLESTSLGVGDNFITDRPITITAGGGTLSVVSGVAILMVRDNSVISGPGTLTKDGAGELRTYSVEHSFGKLIVKGGLYTAGHAALMGYSTSFGAIPASATADAITIYGGASIRKAGGQNLALDPKQGITLAGAGTKTIRSYAGDANAGTFEITGTISGTGPLQMPLPGDSTDGRIVLKGQNTFSDGTIVQPGPVRVYVINNFTGSGTGSGAVTVNGTLGGEGNIGGPVVVNAGTLAPGYTYYTGAVPATEVTKDIARLVLTNGLDMSANGTFAWQLGALSVANPGTDFDQVAVTGGNVTLGGTSTLAIGFIGTATAPSESEPFWQEPRQWKVIALSGGGSVSGNFSAITGTAGITKGTFSTMVDATGVTLVYNPGSAPAGVTNMTISAGPNAGELSIGYSGGGGSQFVLYRSFNVAQTPITTWDRVATNAASPGSFSITIGSDPKAFYYIKAE